jgi:acyl-CoA reductase-like NAD-dependent aldehyde dehydrogenase
MEKLKVNNPYDNKLIKEIPIDGKTEVEKAISISYDLFQSQSNWLPAYKRIDVLERVIAIMRSRVDELIKIAAEEGGKPYVDTEIEVQRAINGVKLAIENIPLQKGEQIPMGHTKSSVNRLAYTMREPIGVVSSISAFNHPLNLIIHQTVPAIAVGSPVIIKPALTTPLSCLAFMEILKEANLPDGWCQAVVCNNNDAEKLATDHRINYLSFIGSARIGWYLRSKLSHGTRCALEHGGAAPVIVDREAEFKTMLPALLKGAFYHAGQVCVSVQRIFAEKNICSELANELASMANELSVGDQLDKATDLGPLISPAEVDRIEEWVSEAINKGGKVLCGGERISDSCYKPTVILNPPDDVRASTEEIFGPVVCVYSYSDRDEAINRANSLPFAFQAAVFTNNLEIAFDTVKKLNATAVMINDHTAFRVDWMPFGGRDSSGIGMGGIQYSMNEMTREKMFVIKSSVL